jgi:hypothetical protein
MTQKEMIETIQQSFPQVGETQIRLMLNRALDKFETEIELLRGTATATVTADDKRRYLFSDFVKEGTSTSLSIDDVLSVDRVDYNNKKIKRFLGTIEETDIS